MFFRNPLNWVKNRIFQTLVVAALIVLFAAGGVLTFYLVRQQRAAKSETADIATLFKQLSELEQKLGVVSADQKTLSEQEAKNRQTIHQKSQDELLTEAVAKVAPAVVSIVISKDVPNLQVTYVNPFGNDPSFKNFGIRVPVYQQNGTTHKKVGAGTGFIIATDGYILTNKHVVADLAADYTVLLSSGEQAPAKIVYLDPSNDIGIVKIDGKYSAATLGNSDSLQLGQSVIAIGNALGEYSNSVSVGIVSGLNRSIEASGGATGTELLSNVIQTDAAINPGNSGGPLLDLAGRVVGINVATVKGSSNISFSIPINTVKMIIKQALGQ